MRKILIIVALGASLSGYMHYYQGWDWMDVFPCSLPRAEASVVTAEEEESAAFLQRQLRNSEGLLHASVQPGKKETYFLLESVGQAMEYAAWRGDKEMFSQYAAVAEHYFANNGQYYSWKVVDEGGRKKEPVSACIDDLRLLKAYMVAHGSLVDNYERQIKCLADKIYAREVTKEGYLCDYYDGVNKEQAPEISLFYLDVDTLAKLKRIDSRWRTPYQKAKEILRNAPGNSHGFYPQKFLLPTREYVWPDTVNMVENLYTALDMQQAGYRTTAFAAFLKREMSQGRICIKYRLDGSAASGDESAAIYALAARFFQSAGEPDFAQRCYQKVMDFRINEGPSKGGIGDAASGMVYAFDHLESLLMMRMVEGQDDK